MKIKINDFSSVSHKVRCAVVNKYLEQYERTIMTNNGLFGSVQPEYTIQVTGKYPVVISVGALNYHVKCKKTKTLLVFTIWLAV